MTQRQRDLLAFIVGYQAAHGGVSPSLDEMAAVIGRASKSSSLRSLNGLQEQGFIRRMPNRARAIEVLRASPSAVTPPSLTFIPIGTRSTGEGEPTAAKDHYPFLGHRTCAEWGGRSLHGEAA